MKLSRYHVVTPPLIDQDRGTRVRVVFASRTATAYIVNDAAWHALSSAAFSELPEELVSELRAIELLVPDDEDELQAVTTRHKDAVRDDRELPLAIQPTAFCQLGCDYCGQHHKPAWLSPSDQDALVERARSKLQSGKYRHLHISWFGAEPLSGINVIRTLSPRLQAAAADAKCTYGATITTNAYTLSADVAAELISEHGVGRFNITLDGTAEHHDGRRHLKVGGDTFSRISANLVALARTAPSHVRIAVRSNVDARNVAGVPSLLRWLADAGIQRRISFYAAPVHSWGNDAHERSLSPDEFAAKELEWLTQMIELGFNPGFLPSLQPIVCLAVQREGELVDAEGTLFNCTEVSYVPAYGDPNVWALGTLETGETGDKRSLLANFNDRVAAHEVPCSDCRMLPVCGGACPKSWLEGHEPCPSAKRNIEGRLALAYAASRLPPAPADAK